MERLIAITLLLQARGKMTSKRLANILGVSKRTIYRDIIALSLAHIPVSMDYGPGGGYYLPDDYHLDAAIFTREEAVSLILSTDMSGSYHLFAGDSDLQRALIKLEAAISDEYRADVKAARERLLFDTSAWCNPPKDAPISYLEIIRAAVLQGKQLDILYPCNMCIDHPHDEVVWRRIEPHGLVFKGLPLRHVRTGRWYLVGLCHVCQSFHTFRIGYIEQLKVCEEQFAAIADFDLLTYWHTDRKHLEQKMPPLTLTLHISPAARYGLKGNTTVLKEEHDRSVIVQVEVESLDDAISYVLGLGTDALVLSPDRVRDAVVSSAHAITSMYNTIRHTK